MCMILEPLTFLIVLQPSLVTGNYYLDRSIISPGRFPDIHCDRSTASNGLQNMMPDMKLEDLLALSRDPTDEEKQFVKQCAEDTDAQLRSIREKIQELQLQETALLDTSMKCKHFVAPIRRLPREIIEGIFKACVDDEYWPRTHPQKAPVVLTHISSHLRHIALTSPLLWSQFSFDLYATSFRGSNKSRARRTRIKTLKIDVLEEWIRRSGVQPLRFQIDFSVICPPLHFPEVLLNCSSRWKDVSLILPDRIRGKEYLLMAADHFPLLSALRILTSEKSHSITLKNSMLKGPNLRQLSIAGAINLLECDVDWSRLININIDISGNSGEGRAMQDLAFILRQSTSLIHLSLVTSYWEYSIIDDIVFPNLRYIAYTNVNFDIHDMPSIASHIHAPLLETLETDGTSMQLEEFLRRHPRLRKLTVRCYRHKFSTISTWLQHLPLLEALRVTAVDHEANTTSELLDTLLLEQEGAVLCPNLQELEFSGQMIEASFPTLNQFLRSAQLGPSPRKYRFIKMKVKIMDWGTGTQQLLNELIQEQRRCGVDLRLAIDNSSFVHDKMS